MRAQQAIYRNDVIRDEEPEYQAQHSRDHCKLLQKFLPAACEMKCGSNAHGDHHHARNSPNAEDQQIRRRPSRITNGRKNQQRHRS